MNHNRVFVNPDEIGGSSLTLAKNVAHSIQVFRGRSEVMNDLDLMVLFTFLRDVLTLAGWERALANYGPGLIDLELQAMSDRDVQELAAALRRMPERLSVFGEYIPREMLNQRKIAPGVVFADYPVRPLLDSALRLAKFISHGAST